MNIQPFKWRLKTSAKGGPISRDALHNALNFMQAQDIKKVFFFRFVTKDGPFGVGFSAHHEGFDDKEPFAAITVI